MSTLVKETTLEDVPEGKHALVVLDSTGDTRHLWDPDNPAEVSAAREVYESLRAKGYQAYAVRDSGARGEVMRDFDPEAGKVIMAPALRGG